VRKGRLAFGQCIGPGIVAVAALWLTACTATGVEPVAAEAPSPPGTTAASREHPPQAPDVKLNLEPDAQFAPAQPADDSSLLDKGFRALAAGEHIEAVKYFQRYQKLESSPLADWEATMAIAYDSMLPQSPFYDPEAARESFLQLIARPVDTARAHETVLLMRGSLATFVELELQLEKLRSENAILTEDLEKREEALRRLRELTLGRTAAPQ